MRQHGHDCRTRGSALNRRPAPRQRAPPRLSHWATPAPLTRRPRPPANARRRGAPGSEDVAGARPASGSGSWSRPPRGSRAAEVEWERGTVYRTLCNPRSREKENRRKEGRAWDRHASVEQGRWPELGGWHRGVGACGPPSGCLSGDGLSCRQDARHPTPPLPSSLCSLIRVPKRSQHCAWVQKTAGGVRLPT